MSLLDNIECGIGVCTGVAVITDEVVKDEFWDKVFKYWNGDFIKENDLDDDKFMRFTGKMTAIGTVSKVITKGCLYTAASMLATGIVCRGLGSK